MSDSSKASPDVAIRIRPASASDAGAIVAFNIAMARETEHLALDQDRVRQGVSALLGDPAKGFYVVAEVEGRVVGQTLITYEWSDWRNATFWWIQSVYVDPAYRRLGVFRRLYEYLLARARAGEACGLRLYVEENNDRARQTYESLGMRRAVYDFYEIDFVITR